MVGKHLATVLGTVQAVVSKMRNCCTMAGAVTVNIFHYEPASHRLCNKLGINEFSRKASTLKKLTRFLKNYTSSISISKTTTTIELLTPSMFFGHNNLRRWSQLDFHTLQKTDYSLPSATHEETIAMISSNHWSDRTLELTLQISLEIQ